MKAEKIHLKTFINTLVSLYNRGVNYISIEKQNDDESGEAYLMISFLDDDISRSGDDEGENNDIEEKTKNDREEDLDVNDLMI